VRRRLQLGKCYYCNVGGMLRRSKCWRCCDCNMADVVRGQLQLGRCCDCNMGHVGTATMLAMLRLQHGQCCAATAATWEMLLLQRRGHVATIEMLAMLRLQHGRCCARTVATWEMLRLQHGTCWDGRNVGDVTTATWAMLCGDGCNLGNVVIAMWGMLRRLKCWRCCDCNMADVVRGRLQLGRCCDCNMGHVGTAAMLAMLRLQHERCCAVRNVVIATWGHVATIKMLAMLRLQHGRCCAGMAATWEMLRLHHGTCCELATAASSAMLCGDECLQRSPGCKPPERNMVMLQMTSAA
jgi:ribosomal protein L30/L7E